MWPIEQLYIELGTNGMYVLNKLKESHGTHLSTFIQVGPRVTKYWIEIVFEGAIIFYIEKSRQNPARFDM